MCTNYLTWPKITFYISCRLKQTRAIFPRKNLQTREPRNVAEKSDLNGQSGWYYSYESSFSQETNLTRSLSVSSCNRLKKMFSLKIVISNINFNPKYLGIVKLFDASIGIYAVIANFDCKLWSGIWIFTVWKFGHATTNYLSKVRTN